jgi:hypothetical protein
MLGPTGDIWADHAHSSPAIPDKFFALLGAEDLSGPAWIEASISRW